MAPRNLCGPASPFDPNKSFGHYCAFGIVNLILRQNAKLTDVTLNAVGLDDSCSMCYSPFEQSDHSSLVAHKTCRRIFHHQCLINWALYTDRKTVHSNNDTLRDYTSSACVLQTLTCPACRRVLVHRLGSATKEEEEKVPALLGYFVDENLDEDVETTRENEADWVVIEDFVRNRVFVPAGQDVIRTIKPATCDCIAGNENVEQNTETHVEQDADDDGGHDQEDESDTMGTTGRDDGSDDDSDDDEDLSGHNRAYCFPSCSH